MTKIIYFTKEKKINRIQLFNYTYYMYALTKSLYKAIFANIVIKLNSH